MPATYDVDLAAHHRDHHTDIAREAATTLVDELAAGHLHRGVIADVGCGDGTLSALAIEAGYDVVAIDPSRAFLTMVAEHAPGAQLVLATAAKMRLPERLVAVACVGEVLSYDLQIDLDEILASFWASLRPGGVLVLDLPGRGRHATQPEVVAPHDESVLLMRTTERGYRLTRDITLFTREDDGRYRRSDEVHELRLYDPSDVRSALARAGFVAVRQPPHYGAGGPVFGNGWSAFIAIRP
jgi:SAM-dependent methyltransferase